MRSRPVNLVTFAPSEWVPSADLQDIADWAVPNNADYIALSFVQIHGTNRLISPKSVVTDVQSRARREATASHGKEC